MPALRRLVLVVVLTCLWAGCASTPTPTPVETPPPQPTLQVGDTTVLAVSPAPQPCCKQDLCQFLGLGKVGGFLGGLGQRLFSRLRTSLDLVGRFPGLQPVPPVLPITDPANLGEQASPSVKVAAEVKAEQDAAPQKIQGLRYLATIGCGGCYPDVEDALLSALDDCTEAVRYEAVLALKGSPDPCAFCRSGACCSPKVTKKLNSIAYDVDDEGCPVEPSDRVRRQARLALDACGGHIEVLSPLPEEGPVAEPMEELADGSRWQAGTIQLASHLTAPSGDPNDIVLAQVNGETIYESQLAGEVESAVAAVGARMQKTNLADLRRSLLRVHLEQAIDRKLVEQAARSEVPTDVDEAGDSYVQDWLNRQLSSELQVSPAEIGEYYQQNQARFRREGAVQWEQVSAEISQFPTRDHARKTIEYIRRQVQGSGLPPTPGLAPELVAIRTYSWDGKQTISRFIAEALKDVAVGQMSDVLEHAGTFHVVRVLQKRPPRKLSLADAAPLIQREIETTRRQQQEQRLLERLHGQADVWTIFQGPRPRVVHAVAGGDQGGVRPTTWTASGDQVNQQFDDRLVPTHSESETAPPQPRLLEDWQDFSRNLGYPSATRRLAFDDGEDALGSSTSKSVTTATQRREAGTDR